MRDGAGAGGPTEASPLDRALDWVAAHADCSAADVARNVRCFKGPGGSERAADLLDARAAEDSEDPRRERTLLRWVDARTVRYRLASPVSASPVSDLGPESPERDGGGDRDEETRRRGDTETAERSRRDGSPCDPDIEETRWTTRVL